VESDNDYFGDLLTIRITIKKTLKKQADLTIKMRGKKKKFEKHKTMLHN